MLEAKKKQENEEEWANYFDDAYSNFDVDTVERSELIEGKISSNAEEDRENVPKLIDLKNKAEPKENFSRRDLEYMKVVTKDGKTEKKLKNSIKNLQILIETEPLIRENAYFDAYRDRPRVKGPLPWKFMEKSEDLAEHRNWLDVDDVNLWVYMNGKYKIGSFENCRRIMLSFFDRHQVHPVRDYINNLPKWDGVERLDTVLVDYLGVEDSEYARFTTRKAFCAGILRMLRPGTQFDYMPVLVGEQGLGKTTFLRKISKGFYICIEKNLSGKDTLMKIAASWIVEFGELSALTKAELEFVKAFFTTSTDSFRPVYGTRLQDVPRPCVFFGTTNRRQFLIDPTGNRRFWPWEGKKSRAKKSVITELDSIVDQLWAEAKYRLDNGEILKLTKEQEEITTAVQRDFEEDNTNFGIIEEALDRLYPEDWDKKTFEERRAWLKGKIEGYTSHEDELFKRYKVCARELYYEVFAPDLRQQPDKFFLKDMNDMLRKLLRKEDGWEEKPIKFGINLSLGTQRGFYNERMKKLNEELNVDTDEVPPETTGEYVPDLPF